MTEQPAPDFLERRASGVLLHPTSLPGPGVGDLGDAAHRWVEWLAAAGQSFWQLLPLVPVDAGGSPYNGLSALAGNPVLVSPARLVEAGLLKPEEVEPEGLPAEQVDYPRVEAWKDELLRLAHRRLREGAAPELELAFIEFRTRHAEWLEDYALFRALRDHFGEAPWTEWEEGARDRDPDALVRWRERLTLAVDRYEFQQFLFHRQWQALRRHAHAAGVRIIGDIPIFVAHDSADVWVNRELFHLDEKGRPTVVAGVPPDYFSETGQRWGNPLYRWDRMAERGYRWWTERFRRTLEMVDVARIDHFRGFEAYWEVPAEEETALNGRWRPGPGAGLFEAVERELGRLPLLAEDLGLITPEVEALRDELGFPGMRVIQFAFDGDPSNPHLPENYTGNSVAYTGTHDNDTACGWWAEAPEEARSRLGASAEREGAEWALIDLVLGSPARLAVVPLQDVLGLGSEARMNTPGTSDGNWSWRFVPGALSPERHERLRETTAAHGRLPAVSPEHGNQR